MKRQPSTGTPSRFSDLHEGDLPKYATKQLLYLTGSGSLGVLKPTAPLGDGGYLLLPPYFQRVIGVKRLVMRNKNGDVRPKKFEGLRNARHGRRRCFELHRERLQSESHDAWRRQKGGTQEETKGGMPAARKAHGYSQPPWSKKAPSMSPNKKSSQHSTAHRRNTVYHFSYSSLSPS